MASVITGDQLGLQLSTQTGIGGRSGIGQANVDTFVNTATGNLVLQRQDQLLTGHGRDFEVLRTYNSLGQLTDDNGDNFRFSFNRRLVAFTGTPNTAGSSITRVAGDGSEAVYQYDVASGRYLTTDGSGAHDSLIFSDAEQSWTWLDGGSAAREFYLQAPSGGDFRLVRQLDPQSAETSYRYHANGFIDLVTNASNETLRVEYDAAGNVVALHQGRLDSNDVIVDELTTTRYSYDADNRLSSITVDLTPADGDITDGVVYSVGYQYHAASHLISVLTQSDGTQVAFQYDAQGRVIEVTRGLGDDAQITRYSYDTSNRSAQVQHVLDAAADVKLTYDLQFDTQGQLIQLLTPPDANGRRLQTLYNYDADGNLTSQSDNAGDQTLYHYDTQGNLVERQDALGNTQRYSYHADNYVATETVFRIADPDGVGAGQPLEPATQRYVYDDDKRLRFSIDADGGVVEYRYGEFHGLPTSTIAYASTDYDVTGLTEAMAPTLAAMQAWSQLQDLTEIQRTDTAHDFRGQVSTVTQFLSTDSAGEGVADGTQSVERFVYDAYGNLLSSFDANATETTYSYDGLNRLTQSVVNANANTINGHTATSRSVQRFFDDANNTLYTQNENGLFTLQVSNSAGDIVSSSEAQLVDVANRTFNTLSQTHFVYDDLGRLVATQDPQNGVDLRVYDNLNRVIARIDSTGQLTEQVYNENHRVIESINYDTAITAAQFQAHLNFVDGVLTSVATINLASLRPATSANDRLLHQVYDAADRLRFQLDEARFVTEIRYNGRGDVISTLRYQTALPQLNQLTVDTVEAFYTDDSLVEQVDNFEVTQYTAPIQNYVPEPRAVNDGQSYTQDIVGIQNQSHNVTRSPVQPFALTSQVSSVAGSTSSVNSTVSVSNSTVLTSSNWRGYAFDASSVQQNSWEGVYAPAPNGGLTTRADVYRNGTLIKSLLTNGINYSGIPSANPPLVGHGIVPISDTALAAGTYTVKIWSVGFSVKGAPPPDTLIKTVTVTKGGAVQPSYITWPKSHQPAGTTAVFSFRSSGSGAYVSKTVTTSGSNHRVNLGTISNGTYDYKIRYKDASNNNITTSDGTFVSTRGSTKNSTRSFIHNSQQVNYSSGSAITGYLSNAQASSIDSITATVKNLSGQVVSSAVTDPDLIKSIVGSYDGRVNLSAGTLLANGRYTIELSIRATNGVVTSDSISYEIGQQTEIETLLSWANTDFDFAAGDSHSFAYRVAGSNGAYINAPIAVNGSRQQVNLGDDLASANYEYLLQTHSSDGQLLYQTRGEFAPNNGALVNLSGNRESLTVTSSNASLGQGEQLQNYLSNADLSGLEYASVTLRDAVTNAVIHADVRTYIDILEQRGGHPGNRAINLQLGSALADGNYLVEVALHKLDGSTSQRPAFVHQVGPQPYQQQRAEFQLQLSDDAAQIAGGVVVVSARYRLAGGEFQSWALSVEGARVSAEIESLAQGNYEYEIQYAYANEPSIVKTVTDSFEVVGSGMVSENVQAKTDLVSRESDRQTFTLYNNNGLQVGAIDAEGFLTEIVYDSSNQPVATIRYANAVAPEFRHLSDINSVRPTSSDTDIRSYNLYNNRGQLQASIDGNGALSEYFYDGVGNLIKTIAYTDLLTEVELQTALTAVNQQVGQLSLGADRALGQVRPLSSAADQVQVFEYDALNQLVREMNIQGVVTQYQYNLNGQIVETRGGLLGSLGANSLIEVTDSSQLRINSRQYDLQGRLIGETSALAHQLGQAAIATSQYQYDAAGRRISATDAIGNRSLYFYDSEGRLLYSVNALGEVTGVGYNTFGENTEQRVFEQRLDTGILAGLSGGVISDQTSAIFSGLQSALDSVTQTQYSQRGQVVQSTDAEGYQTRSSYNRFGEMTELARAINQANTEFVRSQYQYNARGLQVQSVIDPQTPQNPQALTIVEQTVFDAFGRAIEKLDANGNQSSVQYDNVGRVISQTNGLGNRAVQSYDAFGRQLTQTDALGNTTEYHYDDQNRRVTVTSPEGIVTHTQVNAHGETEFTLDGNGDKTHYRYDANGNLIYRQTVLESAGQQDFGLEEQQQYDVANRLIETVDGNGTVTVYSYDAANRVLSRTLDPSSHNPTGLNLTTQYIYSGKGQQVDQIDALGIITRTVYNKNGEVVELIQDPDGLNLLTRYQYDGIGNQVSVEQGDTASGIVRTTVYQYDTAGRRIAEVVDPSGENLTTRYHYDTNGNVTRQENAAGHTTTFVYDAVNQQRYAIDANGSVSEIRYDANGRIIATQSWATQVTPQLYATEQAIQQALQQAALSVEIDGTVAYDPPIQSHPHGQGAIDDSRVQVNDSATVTNAVETHTRPAQSDYPLNNSSHISTLSNATQTASISVANNTTSNSSNYRSYAYDNAGVKQNGWEGLYSPGLPNSYFSYRVDLYQGNQLVKSSTAFGYDNPNISTDYANTGVLPLSDAALGNGNYTAKVYGNTLAIKGTPVPPVLLKTVNVTKGASVQPSMVSWSSQLAPDDTATVNFKFRAAGSSGGFTNKTVSATGNQHQVSLGNVSNGNYEYLIEYKNDAGLVLMSSAGSLNSTRGATRTEAETFEYQIAGLTTAPGTSVDGVLTPAESAAIDTVTARVFDANGVLISTALSYPSDALNELSGYNGAVNLTSPNALANGAYTVRLDYLYSDGSSQIDAKVFTTEIGPQVHQGQTLSWSLDYDYAPAAGDSLSFQYRVAGSSEAFVNQPLLANTDPRQAKVFFVEALANGNYEFLIEHHDVNGRPLSQWQGEFASNPTETAELTVSHQQARTETLSAQESQGSHLVQYLDLASLDNVDYVVAQVTGTDIHGNTISVGPATTYIDAQQLRTGQASGNVNLTSGEALADGDYQVAITVYFVDGSYQFHAPFQHQVGGQPYSSFDVDLAVASDQQPVGSHVTAWLKAEGGGEYLEVVVTTSNGRHQIALADQRMGDYQLKLQYRDSQGELIQQALAKVTVGVEASGVYDLQWQADGDESLRAQTQSIYNDDGQLRFMRDALGFVTEYRYDEAGNRIAQWQYAEAISVIATPTLAATQALLSGNTIASAEYFVYDAAGRVIYQINGSGYLSEQVYDANGLNTLTVTYNAHAGDDLGLDLNQLTQTKVRTAIDMWRVDQSELLDADGVVIDTDATSSELRYQSQIQLWDNAGRLQYQIDRGGIVTEYRYDSQGNATDVISYQQPLSDDFMALASGQRAPIAAELSVKAQLLAHIQLPVTGAEFDPTAQSIASHHRQVFDSAGRQVYRIDQHGYIEEFQYDSLGKITQQLAYKAPVPVSEKPTVVEIQQALVLMAAQWAATQQQTSVDADPFQSFVMETGIALDGLLVSSLNHSSQMAPISSSDSPIQSYRVLHKSIDATETEQLRTVSVSIANASRSTDASYAEYLTSYYATNGDLLGVGRTSSLAVGGLATSGPGYWVEVFDANGSRINHRNTEGESLGNTGIFGPIVSKADYSQSGKLTWTSTGNLIIPSGVVTVKLYNYTETPSVLGKGLMDLARGGLLTTKTFVFGEIIEPTQLTWPKSAQPTETTAVTFKYRPQNSDPTAAYSATAPVSVVGNNHQVTLYNLADGQYDYVIEYWDADGKLLQTNVSETTPIQTFTSAKLDDGSFSQTQTDNFVYRETSVVEHANGTSLSGYIAPIDLGDIDFVNARVYNEQGNLVFGATDPAAAGAILTHPSLQLELTGKYNGEVNLSHSSSLANGRYHIEVDVHYKDGTQAPTDRFYHEVGEQQLSGQQLSWPNTAVSVASTDKVSFQYRLQGSGEWLSVPVRNDDTDFSVYFADGTLVPASQYEFSIQVESADGRMQHSATGTWQGLATTTMAVTQQWSTPTLVTTHDGVGSSLQQYLSGNEAKTLEYISVNVIDNQTNAVLSSDVRTYIDAAAIADGSYAGNINVTVGGLLGDGDYRLAVTLHGIDGSVETRPEFVYQVGEQSRQSNVADVELGELNIPPHTTPSLQFGAQGSLNRAQGILTQNPDGTWSARFPDVITGIFDVSLSFISDESGAVVNELRGSLDLLASGGPQLSLSGMGAEISAQRQHSVFDAVGNVRYQIDGEGFVTAFDYNGLGQLINTTQHANRLTLDLTQSLSLAEVEAALQPNAAHDQVTQIQYDAGGQRSAIVDGANQNESYEYDGLGNRTQVTDKNGQTTRYAYNADGQVSREVTPLGSDAQQGYMVSYDYDGFGNLIAKTVYMTAVNLVDGQGGLIDVDDLAVTLNTHAQQGDRTTRYQYDSQQRMVVMIEPGTGDLGSIEAHYQYDAFGNQVQVIEAYGLPQERVTERRYNDQQQLIEETLAAGTDEATTTRYGYDNFGHVSTIIDPRGIELAESNSDWALAERARLGVVDSATGQPLLAAELSDQQAAQLLNRYTSRQAHNARGDKLAEMDPQGSITRTGYDAFGNITRATDANGHNGYFYYDNNNRLVLQIDPAGYATTTEYNADGMVSRQERYASGLQGFGSYNEWSNHSELLSYLNTQSDTLNQVTAYQYDKLGQVIGVDYGSGSQTLYSEHYAYDAVGNKTSFTDKNGHVFQYQYDAQNRLIAEISPEVRVVTNAATGAVEVRAQVTKYGYDALGNQVSKTEAFGTAQARTTYTEYDKQGNAVRVIGQSADVLHGASGTSGQIALTEDRQYDSAGNLVRERNANGYQVTHYYDDLGRREFSVDADGSVRAWRYDAVGNVVSERVYDQAVSLPVDILQAPALGDSASYRETQFFYDANNLLVGREQGGATLFDLQNGDHQKVVGQYTGYDANGNAMVQIDANGNVSYSFYDDVGNAIVSIDGAGYVTERRYNGSGQVIEQTRYASALSEFTQASLRSRADAIAELQASNLANLLNEAASGVDASAHRRTQFSYDALGRLSEERVKNLAYSQISGNSASEAIGDQVTRYEYDGLNQLVAVVKEGQNTAGVVGDSLVTDYGYDALGRQTSEFGNLYTDHSGETVRERQTQQYDAWGNLVLQVSEAKNDALYNLSQGDQVQRFVYDSAGHLVQSIDANAAVMDYSFDAAGNVVSKTDTQSYIDDSGNLNSRSNVQSYHYDALNRQVEHVDAKGYRYQTAYNQHGEVTAKGMNEGWQEYYQYDDLGRLYKTNEGDGVDRAYLYDANGNVTLEVESAGAALRELSLAQILDLPMNNLDAVVDAQGNVIQGVQASINVYDERNLRTDEIQPEMRFTQTVDGVEVVDNIIDRGEFDAQSVQVQGGEIFRVGFGLYGYGADMHWPRIYYSQKDAYFSWDNLRVENTQGEMVDYTGNVRVDWSNNFGKKKTVWVNTQTGAQSAVNPYFSGYNLYLGNSYLSSNVGQWVQKTITETSGSFVVDAAKKSHTVKTDYGYGGSMYAAQLKNRAFTYQATVYTQNDQGQWEKLQQYSGRYGWDARSPGKHVGVKSLTTNTQTEPVVLNLGEQSSATKSIKLHLRRGGQNGDFLNQNYDEARYQSDRFEDSVNAIRGSDGKWRLDLSNLKVGGQSLVNSVDYEYYYEVLDQAGLLLSRQEGVLNWQGVNTQLTQQATHRPSVGSLDLGYVIGEGIDVEQGIHRQLSYNAFGEVSAEIDGRGHQTQFEYSTAGQLLQKRDPEVSVTLASGLQQQAAPVTQYHYDLLGRVVGTSDANGYTNTQSWAGDKVAGELHADSGSKSYGYDEFGNKRSETNELGQTTAFGYDKVGNLLNVDRVGSNDDSYSYDQHGNRITHTNALGLVEKYKFDGLDRITRFINSANKHTVYGYEWRADIGDSGGWRKTTNDANGSSLSANHYSLTTVYNLEDDTDYFGKIRQHKDMAGRKFTYQYDAAGNLVQQTGTGAGGVGAGQHIEYSYYANGLVRSINDFAVGSYADFQYDENGNLTFEGYQGADPTDPSQPNGTYYQRSNVEYDALNRVVSISDAKYDITYEWDAVGNRRRVHSRYLQVDGSTRAQDFWYDYDAMNRFTVTQGRLVDGERGNGVERGSKGYDIVYNALGQRVSANYGDTLEVYQYDNNGFLTNTRINGQLRAQRINDAIGRTTRYTEWRSDGTLFRRNDNTYSADNLKTKEVTKHYKDNGAVDKTVTTNHTFDANGNMLSSINNDSTKIENYYRYDLWDNYKQSRATIEATSADELDSEWKPGYSDTRYDVNGNVEEVVDHYNARILRYANNHKGQVLSRTEEGNGYFNQHNYYYLNGVGIGDVGNDGPDRTDYAMLLAASQGKQRDADDVKPVFSADFDANYQPIGPNYPAQSPGSYTVQGGEDLKSIALSVWGDASLWYLIADSNGLTGSESLPAGTELILPNKVTNIHNNSGTYRPYDPGVTLGDVGPTLPDAPPPPINADGGCGGAQIIVAVIAVVATIFTAGALGVAFAGLTGGSASAVFAAGVTALSGGVGFGAAVGIGFAAGAVGSLAGQVAGIGLGVQDSIDWGGVARGGVTTAITAGAGNFLGGLDKGASWFEAAKFAAKQTVLSQAVSTALGVQKRFDWRAVAANTVSAGVSRGIAGKATGEAVKGAGQASEQLSNWDQFADQFTDASKIGNALLSSTINEGVSSAIYKRDFDFAAVGSNAVVSHFRDALGTTAREAEQFGGSIDVYVPSSETQVEAQLDRDVAVSSHAATTNLPADTTMTSSSNRQRTQINTLGDDTPVMEEIVVTARQSDGRQTASSLSLGLGFFTDELNRPLHDSSKSTYMHQREYNYEKAQWDAHVARQSKLVGAHFDATYGAKGAYTSQGTSWSGWEVQAGAISNAGPLSGFSASMNDAFFSGAESLIRTGSVLSGLNGADAAGEAWKAVGNGLWDATVEGAKWVGSSTLDKFIYDGLDIFTEAQQYHHLQEQALVDGLNLRYSSQYDDYGVGGVVAQGMRDVVGVVGVGKLIPSVRVPNNVPAEILDGVGPLRPSARKLLKNENLLIDASHGLQSRQSALFDNVVEGVHSEGKNTYLWTIDQRGVNAAIESTPFPTPRGNIVHSNISKEASIAGEAWFGPNNTVTINAGSGRFGDGAGITTSQWDSATRYWENLGYSVNPVPYGKR